MNSPDAAWAQFSGCIGWSVPAGWLLVNPMMGAPHGM